MPTTAATPALRKRNMTGKTFTSINMSHRPKSSYTCAGAKNLRNNNFSKLFTGLNNNENKRSGRVLNTGNTQDNIKGFNGDRNQLINKSSMLIN